MKPQTHWVRIGYNSPVPFESFIEAVLFAIKYNGVLETPIYNP
jgi:hypothetical protein